MAQVSSRRQIAGLGTYGRRDISKVAESSVPDSSAASPSSSPSSPPSPARSTSRKTRAKILSRAVSDQGPSNSVSAQQGVCKSREAHTTLDRRQDAVHRSNRNGTQSFRTPALEQSPGSEPEPIEFPKLPAYVLQQAPEFEFVSCSRLAVLVD